MIDKIERIKNIGNFENYEASGNVSLGKMSYIYASNGAGKTTLARVLQSLSSNDGSIIDRHKRIGATGEPSVILKSGTDCYKFKDGGWDNCMPNVAVFDAHFVANNVYSGFEINSEHHKSLYQFVVGDAGVGIIKKIERVKTLIDGVNAEINQYGQLLRAETGSQDIIKVLNISANTEIDKLIEDKEKELTLAKSQEQIAVAPTPQVMTSTALLTEEDFIEIREALELSVDGIGNEYLTKVKAHLKHLEDEGLMESSGWVYKGLKHADDNCPFCGRQVKDVELIEGYHQYFSKQYVEAGKRVEKSKASVEGIKIDSHILNLTTQYRQIGDRLKYWNTLLPVETELPPFDIENLHLEERYKNLATLISQKVSNPVTALPTEKLDDFKQGLDTLAELVTKVNDYVTEYVKKIADLRRNIKAVDVVDRELKELKLTKARFEEPLKGYCIRYTILNQQCSRLGKINKELQRKQKTASNLMFNQYGSKINDYLKNVFHTPFQIEGIKDGGFKGTSKRPNLDYTLTFNGTPIKQGDGGATNTSFKNVLSEGDKNTIAFSFFLAKLTSDPHYSDKIVVFDDPLTSLDLNRRTATIEQLVKLYGDCNQVIVLSHNLHFLIDLNTRKRVARDHKRSLQIVNRKGKSEIVDYSIKSEWIDRYKKAIITMTNYVENPNPDKQDEAVNSIRLSLETYLKMKFCLYIPDFNLTFGKLIDSLKTSPCTFVNPDKDSVIRKLMDLDEMSWKTHHGTLEEMEEYHEVDLSPEEAENYVQKTLDMLANEL